jgi:hypothetical protein
VEVERRNLADEELEGITRKTSKFLYDLTAKLID